MKKDREPETKQPQKGNWVSDTDIQTASRDLRALLQNLTMWMLRLSRFGWPR